MRYPNYYGVGGKSSKPEYLYVVKFERTIEDEMEVFAPDKKTAIERVKDEVYDAKNFEVMKTGTKR
jgi:hypothetical protein